MAEHRCEIRQASDGTKVRVNGNIDQELLDRLAAQVQKWADSRCDSENGPEMIAVAQRIHGRKNHRCGREQGHDGPHRWPDRPDGAEWPAEPPTPAPIPGDELTAAESVSEGAGS